MDDPADSCWNWPHWKFGLKREDLFLKLHQQYNTISSSILDPEAFHHDVCQISHEATSADEFHRLLDDRKQQRLRELNESLESASFEIIANPSLIGSEQWQHAVQLFRTRSLDSLVRYFASYLPADHPWYRAASSSSASEAGSSAGSLADSHGSLFDEDGPIMTDEPLEYSTDLMAPSPRSMTMCSDSSVASPIDDVHHDYDINTLTPARTLSFSESEPDCCAMPESHPRRQCDHDPQPVDAKSAGVTLPETAGGDLEYEMTPPTQKSPYDGTIQQQSTIDVTESETPTPKPEGQSTAFFDMKPSLQLRRHRSLSPSRPHPLSECDLDQIYTNHRDPRNTQMTRLRRECSPVVHRRRRGPGEPATRIQKSQPEAARSRPRGRRWVEC
ncbi:hypothetical protein MFIFM68171_00133 [Madurella fahalii]|uniref:Uncharacterized protein n=1 Tax=Madurella fahalii TaxID=1157608 RepID=A0ABQ0FWP4_9PEZI